MKFEAKNWEDYELLDAGGGNKYERFGNQYFIRPESLAYFKSALNYSDWAKEVDFIFEEINHQKGNWKKKEGQEEWKIQFDEALIQLKLTKFKHIGIFPEQEINWRYIKGNLNSDSKFLNLFGYTGVASIVAARTGAKVVHVDSIKQIVNWASENAAINKVETISWVVEDALKFAQKELRREKKYDGIIMDPPAFGLGPKGQKWKIEDNIEELIQLGVDLLNPGGFFILNTYSPKLPLKKLRQLLDPHKHKGSFQAGELISTTNTGKTLLRGNLVRFEHK